jgi:hypothetical protein
MANIPRFRRISLEIPTGLGIANQPGCDVKPTPTGADRTAAEDQCHTSVLPEAGSAELRPYLQIFCLLESRIWFHFTALPPLLRRAIMLNMHSVPNEHTEGKPTDRSPVTYSMQP